MEIFMESIEKEKFKNYMNKWNEYLCSYEPLMSRNFIIKFPIEFNFRPYDFVSYNYDDKKLYITMRDNYANFPLKTISESKGKIFNISIEILDTTGVPRYIENFNCCKIEESISVEEMSYETSKIRQFVFCLSFEDLKYEINDEATNKK